MNRDSIKIENLTISYILIINKKILNLLLKCNFVFPLKKFNK